MTASSRETGRLELTGSRCVQAAYAHLEALPLHRCVVPPVQEHIATNFLSAWSTPIPGVGDGFVTDAAIRVVALSRWNNYYVEGVQQMMRDFALDG